MGERLASRADVARLLGRVAFGATPAELDTWTGRPYTELVDHLLDVPDGLTRTRPDDVARAGREAASGGPLQQQTRAQSLKDARSSWLERMRTTSWPLLERMTLLWHDHFATAVGNPMPDVAMLLLQNDTLRRHALGSFRELVTAIDVDPAMLHWLNGAQSAPPYPNENYARELFELFTLGKQPQVFTEDDIRNAARALTGWTVNNGTRASSFDARRHDTGQKRVLGQVIGNEGATEHVTVARIALDHPVSARFVAYKMVRNLGYDPGGADLLRSPEALVAKVADRLRATGWDISEALRTLLNADEFRYARAQRVRTPVEQVVHACKSLKINAGSDQLIAALDRMGQSLFDPPNVGGWPVDVTWLSPASTVARYQVASHIHQTWNGQSTLTRVALPGSSDLAAWAALLGMPGFSPSTTDAVRSYLAARPKAPEAELQQGVLTLLLNSPDWVVL